MEKVLCFKRKDLPREWLVEKGAVIASESAVARKLSDIPALFVAKDIAEQTPLYKQIIPYIILKNSNGEIFYYQRRGSEKRLSNLYSVGIGGHINEQDQGDDLLSTIHKGLRREFYEETGIPYIKFQSQFFGIINEEISKVGKTHLGLVYCLSASSKSLKYQFSEELLFNGFESIDKFLEEYNYEFWSGLALKLVKKGEQQNGQ